MVKIHFMNGALLSKRFAPPKNQLHCTKDCETCSSAVKINQCFRKKYCFNNQFECLITVSNELLKLLLKENNKKCQIIHEQ